MYYVFQLFSSMYCELGYVFSFIISRFQNLSTAGLNIVGSRETFTHNSRWGFEIWSTKFSL